MAKIVDLGLLESIMQEMGKEGNIFQNESGFQKTFAEKIKAEVPECEVFMECWTANSLYGRCYTDIIIQLPQKKYIAIELKYKLAACEGTKFKNQSAQDLGRYDFLYDVYRNEQLLENSLLGYEFVSGYTIILTNDHLYWRVPSKTFNYDQFRLDNGNDDLKIPVVIQRGKKEWGYTPSKLEKTYREGPICLKKDYEYTWTDYCKCGENSSEKEKNNIFKYLIFETK